MQGKAVWVWILAASCALAIYARGESIDIKLKPDVPEGYPDRVGRFQKPLRQDITSLRMIVRDHGKYDFEFPTASDVPALRGIDLRPFMPRIPKLANGDATLIRLALIQRELNRNQTRYDLPEFHGSAWIANNCLKRGLWEIGLDKTDEKGQITVFHAWFEMPKAEYTKLYTQVNGSDATMADCEGYPELNHFAVPLDHLRQVINDQALPKVETNLADTIYQLPEQARKAKLVVLATQDNYSTLLSSAHQPIKTAKFSEPGFYTNADPVQFNLSWLTAPAETHWRTVRSDAAAKTLDELELKFANGNRIILGGNLSELPAKTAAPKDEKEVLRVTFGISTPDIYANAPERAREFASEPLNYLLLLDKDGNNIDNHKGGIDRVFAWRGQNNTLHLYLVGYERIMLVSHLTLSYPPMSTSSAQGG